MGTAGIIRQAAMTLQSLAGLYRTAVVSAIERFAHVSYSIRIDDSLNDTIL
jgi:hypothetical protein